MKFLTKKRVAAAVGALAIGGSGMAAYAYFTSSGSGSGTGAVGTSTAFSVTNVSASGNMYPGDPTGASVTYKITNPSTGHQAVRTVTVALANDGASPANVVDSGGTPITGCLASWFTMGSSSFTASGGGAVTLTADLAGGDYINGSTQLTMGNVGSSQDACKSAAPKVTVTVG